MAPFVAALLKGGLGLLANAVLVNGKDWIERETGVKLGDNLTPEQQVLLKQYELQHEEALLRLALENNKLEADIEGRYLADRANARQMNMETIQSNDPLVRRFPYYFAATSLILASMYIGFITFGEIPEQNIRFADTTLGFLLGTLISGIFQFFFGSSRDAVYNGRIVDAVVTKAVEKGAEK